MNVVHRHRQDGQHESRINMGMLRADDRQRVHLGAVADIGSSDVSRAKCSRRRELSFGGGGCAPISYQELEISAVMHRAVNAVPTEK